MNGLPDINQEVDMEYEEIVYMSQYGKEIRTSWRRVAHHISCAPEVFPKRTGNKRYFKAVILREYSK